MKIIYIVLLIVIIGFVINILSTSHKRKQKLRQREHTKPYKTKDNDRIVLIENATTEQIQAVFRQMCNEYNYEEYIVLPQVSFLGDNRFAVTFPYDISFESFCFLINFLYYPIDTEWAPRIVAWTRLRREDRFVTEDMHQRNAMLYIPPHDEDHFSVWITLENNQSYTLCLNDETLIQLPETELSYTAPEINAKDLYDKVTESFE